jgi:hypothetical protein
LFISIGGETQANSGPSSSDCVLFCLNDDAFMPTTKQVIPENNDTPIKTLIFIKPNQQKDLMIYVGL